MADWDSADLLRRFKLRARRPTVDQAVPDAMVYDFLTEAQPEVYQDVFSRYPEFGYSAPVLLTSSDGGKTFGWGNDSAGDAIRPTGHAEIYPSLNAIPASPLVPGADYLIEGSKIRIPGNSTRTFAAGPYSRFVARPEMAITSVVQPQLQPKSARILLMLKALEFWAGRPGSGADPAQFEDAYNKRLNKVFLELATAYNMRGAQGTPATSERAWWYSGDLGQNAGLNL